MEPLSGDLDGLTGNESNPTRLARTSGATARAVYLMM